MAIMSIYLLPGGEDLVLREAYYYVIAMCQLLNHHGHNNYMSDAAWGGPCAA